MSLNKRAERRKKIIEQNRKLRQAGVVLLTDPGPWYPVPIDLQFAPNFFKGLIEQAAGIDTPPAK